MIHVSEKFVPEVLTYLFEEWTGSALLSMGPLCYRFESPRRKLINATNFSISIENRISGLLPLSLTCNFPKIEEIGCRHSMWHILSITKIMPATNFPYFGDNFPYFDCRHSMWHISSITKICHLVGPE